MRHKTREEVIDGLMPDVIIKKAISSQINPSDWYGFDYDGYKVQAKVYVTGSSYGINDGPVSKLNVRASDGTEVYNYDRGLDVDELDPSILQGILSKIEQDLEAWHIANPEEDDDGMMQANLRKSATNFLSSMGALKDVLTNIKRVFDTIQSDLDAIGLGNEAKGLVGQFDEFVRTFYNAIEDETYGSQKMANQLPAAKKKVKEYVNAGDSESNAIVRVINEMGLSEAEEAQLWKS